MLLELETFFYAIGIRNVFYAIRIRIFEYLCENLNPLNLTIEIRMFWFGNCGVY